MKASLGICPGVPMPGMPRGIRGKAGASDKEGDRQVYKRGPERESKAGWRGRGEGSACGPTEGDWEPESSCEEVEESEGKVKGDQELDNLRRKHRYEVRLMELLQTSRRRHRK